MVSTYELYQNVTILPPLNKLGDLSCWKHPYYAFGQSLREYLKVVHVRVKLTREFRPE
jgi:hypothetical protein